MTNSQRRKRSQIYTKAVPAFFLLGVLVELQFQIIPAYDPSGGWSRHIWDHYGPAIADCAMEAGFHGPEILWRWRVGSRQAR